MEIYGVLLNGFLTGLIYSQMALGLSVLYGVMRLINFAHGEMITGSMLILCFLEKSVEMPLFFKVFVVIIFFVFVFFFLNKVLFQKIMGQKDTVQFISMAALAMILLNVTLVFFKADTYCFNYSKDFSNFVLGNLVVSNAKLLAAAISFFSTLVLFLFFKMTLVGKTIRAISMNPKVAYYWGINRQSFFKIAFFIVSISIVLSSFSLLLTMDVSIQTAPEITLLCFVIVILGGLGSLPGTVIASLLIGFLESMIGYYGSSVYKSFFSFLVFIIIILFRPQGLLGKK